MIRVTLDLGEQRDLMLEGKSWSFKKGVTKTAPKDIPLTVVKACERINSKGQNVFSIEGDPKSLSVPTPKKDMLVSASNVDLPPQHILGAASRFRQLSLSE